MNQDKRNSNPIPAPRIPNPDKSRRIAILFFVLLAFGIVSYLFVVYVFKQSLGRPEPFRRQIMLLEHSMNRVADQMAILAANDDLTTRALNRLIAQLETGTGGRPRIRLFDPWKNPYHFRVFPEPVSLDVRLAGVDSSTRREEGVRWIVLSPGLDKEIDSNVDEGWLVVCNGRDLRVADAPFDFYITNNRDTNNISVLFEALGKTSAP